MDWTEGYRQRAVAFPAPGPTVAPVRPRTRVPGRVHRCGDKSDATPASPSSARSAITAVAESPQLRRSGSFEEGGGYVIEHQVRAQAEQIPQFQEDLLFDARFLCAQIIQTLIPKSQLFKVHLHPAGLLPHRHPATAFSIAYEIVFQPLRQSVLTARTSETIRQQRENAF